VNKKIASSVIIVGGGWSGLAAAVDLLKAGHHVTLFESAKQLGGRARCVAFNQYRVDNGQHLLLGAYKDTLSVLRICGVDLNKVLLRLPLDVSVIDRHGDRLHLAPGELPSPLNILIAFMTLPGVSLRDRFKTCLFLLKQRISGFTINRDISVRKLLRHQPEKLITMLWEPLCIAALNTSINDSSARIFLNVLKDSLTQGANASDLLIPKVDLGQLFVHPTMQYIDQHGGNYYLGKKIEKISSSNGKPIVIDSDGNSYSADNIILAGSPKSTATLLDNSRLLEQTQKQIQQLRYEPICTVYLQYPEDIKLPQPMIGLTNCTGQWIFDRQFCNQPGLMAVVISASGPHMQLDKMTLAQIISDELSDMFGWPDSIKTLVIREKRATFKSHVDVAKLRPANSTSEHNIWLCGDYTASPYPATLEAAVQSGLQCSQKIIQSMN